jgi:hypothetical protein
MSHLRAEPVNIEVDCARIHAGRCQEMLYSCNRCHSVTGSFRGFMPLKTLPRKPWHAACISRSPRVFPKVNLRLISSVTREVASVEDEFAGVGGRGFARWRHVETGESVS